jgi:phospholipid/cholesterol/gamma-HCH transport system ATP-binding protein
MSTNNQSMIEINNLSKSYGENLILNNINLNINKGSVLALIGFSGSGKSTMLKILAGLTPADSGQIKMYSNKIGMAFQYSALFDSMTVADNVIFPLIVGEDIKKIPDEKYLKELAIKKLQLVGLQGVEDLYPSELSGGMKKRVSFARAVINDPEIIFYDEPTAGLDPVASTIIEDLIVKLQQETSATSIVVTHQASTIKRTATEVAMLFNGNIVWTGTPRELFDTNNSNPFAKQFREGSLEGPMEILI